MEKHFFECFITHVEREGPLLKVWAQLERKIPTYIEKAILQLVPQFDSNHNVVTDPMSLKVGQLCCAKYSDGSYYRARITSLSNIATGEVAVQFADYGNHEIIPLNNMRTLGVLESLASINDQASDFYLSGVYPRGGDWSMEILRNIREVICYSDIGFFHVDEITIDNTKRVFIQLMYDHQDFAQVLIAKNMGFAITTDTQKALLTSLVERKPLPSLTLWPPFNPSEPPPNIQMMVLSSVANVAQRVAAESHERRITQQMQLQSHPVSVSMAGAQKRLIHAIRPVSNCTEPASSYTAPSPHHQTSERMYNPHSAQARLEQLRIQQESSNQNLPVPDHRSQLLQQHYSVPFVHNIRMPQPINQQPYVNALHSQPSGMEQFASSPLPVATSSSSTQPYTKVTSELDKHHNDNSPAHVFNSRVLEVDTDYEVFVSFAEDGPGGFAVQLSSLEEILGNLLEEINKTEPLPFTQPLMPGCTCLGRYTMDQTLCRAVVVSVHTDTCQVYYVDFGNSEELPFSEIFELPKRFVLEPPVMAVRFTLAGLKSITVTNKIKSLFSNIVNNKQFLLRVVPPEGPPLRQYGILFDEGRSVLDVLKEQLKANPVPYLPIDLPNVGSNEVVCVAYVEHVGKFFVQKQDNVDALESVMEEVASHCTTAAMLSDDELTQGIPCCSLYSDDELWYRARIKAITDCGVRVDYVDYGNTELVQLDSLRKISDELVTAMECQAIACCLNKLQHVEVDDDMMNKFSALTDDKPLTMEVIAHLPDGRLVVELHDTTNFPAVNIGAALRAPKQHPNKQPTQPKVVEEAAVDITGSDWRETKESHDSYNINKSAHDTHELRYKQQNKRNSSLPNKGGTQLYSFGKPRSTESNWRLRNEDQEEKSSNFYRNKAKDRYQSRNTEHEEDHTDGNREEENQKREKRRGGCYDSDREDRRGNRFVGGKDDMEDKGSHGERRENRFGNGDSEDRRSNRFAFDRDDRKGKRFNQDYEGQDKRCENRFERKGGYSGDGNDGDGGGDRENKRNSRFGGDREQRGGYNAKVGHSEQYSRGKDTGWGNNEQKKEEWGDSDSNKSWGKPKKTQVFASPDQRFTEEVIDSETNVDVVVTWFINPNQFFVQVSSKQSDIETLMKNIQAAYCGVLPNVDDIEVGSPLIARYPADQVLYRAEVIGVKDGAYIVRYIDFGNCEVVQKSNLWQIESQFLDLPKQALLCSLKGVEPIDGNWTDNQESIDVLFQDNHYLCIFHDKLDEKHIVTLTHGDNNVAEELILNKLAHGVSVDGLEVSVEEPIKKELYDGQTLKCHVTYVEGVARFYGHFDVTSATKLRNHVENYVLDENVTGTSLPTDRIVIGQLCLASTDLTEWYRAEIVEAAETDGVYYVTFIDYGDGDEVPVNQMIGLPEELCLSAYPIQATEMFLTGSGETEVEPETEDLFKANLEMTDVFVHVDSVSDERLNVTIYTMEGMKYELVKNIGSGMQVIDSVLPHPILAQKVSVFVSHADSASNIWLQLAKNNDVLTDLLDRLFAFYEEGDQALDLTPEENQLCAAKSVNDDGWYRAKIVSVSPEGTEVLYFDYGNSEVIPVENIKLLDPSFHTPHALAFNVTLPVVVKEEVEPDTLTEMTSEVKFISVFHRDEEKRWYADLLHKKETFTEMLVDKGWVNMAENYPFTSIIEELRKLPKLLPCMQVLMFVSHVDSPSCFWIQRDDTSTEIEELQADLQSAVEDLETLDNPTPNILCAAKYSQDDLWYRATILDVQDSSVCVRFVDYGNSDTVDVSSTPLKKLSPKFLKYDEYAIHCGLNVLPLDTEFSTEATQSFEALIAEADDTLVAQIVAIRDVTVIDIFLGDRSFTASLLADNLVLEFVADSTAYVSHAISPSEFWIQPERATKLLDILSERMTEAAEFEPLSEVSEGTICAALFDEDEQWYRAHITSRSEEGTKVQFIDFGNSAISTEFRKLPEDLAAMSPVAKYCSLAFPSNMSDWPEAAIEKFLNLVVNDTTSFVYEIVSNEGVLNIVKLTYENKDVGDVIMNWSSVEEFEGHDLPQTNEEESQDNEQPIEDSSETGLKGKEKYCNDVEGLPTNSDEDCGETIDSSLTSGSGIGTVVEANHGDKESSDKGIEEQSKAVETCDSQTALSREDSVDDKVEQDIKERCSTDEEESQDNEQHIEDSSETGLKGKEKYCNDVEGLPTNSDEDCGETICSSLTSGSGIGTVVEANHGDKESSDKGIEDQSKAVETCDSQTALSREDSVDDKVEQDIKERCSTDEEESQDNEQPIEDSSETGLKGKEKYCNDVEGLPTNSDEDCGETIDSSLTSGSGIGTVVEANHGDKESSDKGIEEQSKAAETCDSQTALSREDSVDDKVEQDIKERCSTDEEESQDNEQPIEDLSETGLKGKEKYCNDVEGLPTNSDEDCGETIDLSLTSGSGIGTVVEANHRDKESSDKGIEEQSKAVETCDSQTALSREDSVDDKVEQDIKERCSTDEEESQDNEQPIEDSSETGLKGKEKYCNDVEGLPTNSDEDCGETICSSLTSGSGIGTVVEANHGDKEFSDKGIGEQSKALETCDSQKALSREDSVDDKVEQDIKERCSEVSENIVPAFQSIDATEENDISTLKEETELSTQSLDYLETVAFPIQDAADSEVGMTTADLSCPQIKSQFPDVCSSLIHPEANQESAFRPSSSRPMTPRNNAEKIVPGSIGGGVSFAELNRVSTESEESPFLLAKRNIVDKIVPGSISRGISDEEVQNIMCSFNAEFEHSNKYVPDTETSHGKTPEVVKSCPSTPVSSANRPLQRTHSAEMDCSSPRKIKHAERIVPGCISSGFSSSELITTLHEDVSKLQHEEKIVPGSVSRGISSEEIELGDSGASAENTNQDNATGNNMN